jgi:hypothetical protein
MANIGFIIFIVLASLFVHVLLGVLTNMMLEEFNKYYVFILVFWPIILPSMAIKQAIEFVRNEILR